MKYFNDVIMFVFVIVFLVFAVIFSPINTVDNNVLTGFASSPVYSGYAVPINSIVVDTNVVFNNVTDVAQKSVDVSDDIIYRRAYVSYDGSSWSQFNLTPTGTATGEWIYGRGISNIVFSPSILHLNNSRNFTNDTYIIIYSCSKNITIHNWSCHDGWQIIPFNAKLNSASSDSVSPIIIFVTPPTPSSGSTINISIQEIVASISDISTSVSSWIDFDKSLVGYWGMDYYSSSGIFDNSSYKNFGTFTGELSTNNIVSGVRGKGLSFDGVNDALNLPLSTSVAGKSDISLSLWAYFSDVSTARALYSDYVADGSWKFALNQGFITSNRLDVEFRNINTGDTGTKISLVSSINTPVKQWVHIVVVYSVSLDYVKIYMNGVEVGSSTSNINAFTSTSSAGILVGNDGDSGSPDGFSGTIDEVMLFNRALSSSEVKALYDSKNNNFDATLSGLSNGQHTYTIYAIDGNGNIASSSQRTLNVNAAITCIPSCSGKQCGSDGCSGTCGTCSNSHGTTSCSSSGLCQPTCTSGYANCDSSNVNGCETQLGTTSNCALCGNVCSFGQTCTSNVCTTPSTPPPSGTGNTYYVSPSGNDNNLGTISSPWFTLNKAWSAVSAGDIIYMRGGTYRYGTSGTVFSGKSGTSSNYITIENYPGEKPIINYSDQTFTSQLIGIYLTNVNYVHLKGFRITSINQPAAGSIAQYGILLDGTSAGASNCIFEQMETDHIGGWGVVIGKYSSNNLFLNCDSHHNADPYTGSYNGEPYGWSDGFEMGSHGAATSTNIIFRGCRAWSNSDDGWDLRQADGVYTIENCWSFWNGYIPGTWTQGGDGEGYKLGGSTVQTNSIIRTVTNCLAFENRLVGFSPEPDVEPNNDLGVVLYNSVSYKNALGINFEYKNVATLRNNIIYANTVGAMYNWGGNVVHDHNVGVISDLSYTVTNADFVSVNSAGADGPRQADGSLPNLTFLHLAPGSKLISAGVNVGLSTDGVGKSWNNPPSIGAYEYP